MKGRAHQIKGRARQIKGPARQIRGSARKITGRGCWTMFKGALGSCGAETSAETLCSYRVWARTYDLPLHPPLRIHPWAASIPCAVFSGGTTMKITRNKLVHQQIVSAALLYPKPLVNVQRMPFPGSIKLGIRGFFRARRTRAERSHLKTRRPKAHWAASLKCLMVSSRRAP